MAQLVSARSEAVPSESIRFADAGFALHWLKPRSKAPIGKDWSTAPVATADVLRASYQPGHNVGVRLGEPSRVAGGYLHAIDMDIRVADLADEAWDALRDILGGVDPDTLPMVASGSGGESRHLYFVTDRPFYSRKLAYSEGKHRGADGKWHYDWEIELFGTGKQVAFPPSIHPDTGKPYTWLRPFDLDMLEFGIAPTVPASRLAEMAEAVSATYEFETVEPLTFKAGQLERDLTDIPDSRLDDYQDWVTLGQALHHQFGGAREGYDLWVEQSKRSDKFNEREMPGKWRGFGRSRRRPVTMASVRQWAIESRSARMFDAFDDLPEKPQPAVAVTDPDVAALLGGGEEPAAKPYDPLDAPVELDWRSLLDFNEDTGAIKATLHNLQVLVANDPRTRGLPEHNDFTREIVQRRRMGRKENSGRAPAKPVLQLDPAIWTVDDPMNGTLWCDTRDRDIRKIFEAPKTQGGYGIKITDRDLSAAVDLTAHRNRFHPVKEYLQSLEWDGVLRAETIFVDYLGADDNQYTRDIARLMLVAAVCRVHEPGHKFDFAVIIEGAQGRGKSTFIRILGKNWFTELEGNFSDPKQMVELMQGAWIVEIPELSGFNRSDVRTIKAFISRQDDKVRLAYARRAAEFPRQCVFIGSTNDYQYIKDDSGGRRWWPVRCSARSIDLRSFRANIDQIWAEAVFCYKEMRRLQPVGTLPLHLSNEASNRIAFEMQSSRTVESEESVAAGIIGEWLDRPVYDGGIDSETAVRRDVTCSREIYDQCLKADRPSYSHGTAQMIGRAMELVPGWRKAGHMKFDRYGMQRSFKRI